MITTVKDCPGPRYCEFNQLAWVESREQTLLKARLPVTVFYSDA